MNASTRIYEKMDQQLYKRHGRKYIPVNDPFALDGLRMGWWLVKVSEGCTSIRQQVYPYKAEITAAARDKEEELVKIIREASEARPHQRPITPEALADWNAFMKKHGNEFSSLEYPSIQENAERIIKALIE